MIGQTASLWPIRYKPERDELLSSWLVRLSYGHGLKVQTFCNLLFGNRHQVWNRDIDRLAPSWLVDVLSAKTGTPPARAHETTLRGYEGELFPQFKLSGTLQWMQTLKLYHRTRQAFGQQFCGECLAADSIPYFRRSWRVSFNTVCPRHNAMLSDRCHFCGAAVAFFRMDIGHAESAHPAPMSACHACGEQYAATPRCIITACSVEVKEWLVRESASIGVRDLDAALGVRLGELSVLRQLVALLVSRLETVQLRSHIVGLMGIEEVELTAGRIPFESRQLAERHYLLQLAGWMMLDLEAVLQSAWRARAIRYNHLSKGFPAPPAWYVDIVKPMEHWRLRLGGKHAGDERCVRSA